MINDDKLGDDEFDDDENREDGSLTVEELEGELIVRLELEDLDPNLSYEIMESIGSHLFGLHKAGVKHSDDSLIGVLSPSVSYECEEVLVSYCIGRRGFDTSLRETIYKAAIFNPDQINLVIFITDKWDKNIWEHHQKAFDAMGATGLVYFFSSDVFTREY